MSHSQDAFGLKEQYPDLIFGLVGPIGVDLLFIEQTLKDYLNGFSYCTHTIRISAQMREIECGKYVDDSSTFAAYNSKMDYANCLRQRYDNAILAALAIAAIKEARGKSKSDSSGNAFVIRQLKNPDEVRLLRSVYGKQFIQISIYGSPSARKENLSAEIRIDSNGVIEAADADELADKLMARDEKEEVKYGQALRDVFPLGDVFVDTGDKNNAAKSIERFLSALMGSNEISPTPEEYGMYLAKSASLRSLDLSRQVGAAIFSRDNTVISLGSNEVPKARGGTYWPSDGDARDFRRGYDPNELNKREVFADLIKRLLEDEFLSAELLELGSPHLVVEKLLNLNDGTSYKESRVMDIIEYGRIIHAEMSAICDAARNGQSISGGVLYSTTFPCHLCAKHIVASGLDEVVYLEPYPKSYALNLHSDSISLTQEADKVRFRPFMGISPTRYRDLFEKGKRKTREGRAMKWQSEQRRPSIDYMFSPSNLAEPYVLVELSKLILNQEKDE